MKHMFVRVGVPALVVAAVVALAREKRTTLSAPDLLEQLSARDLLYRLYVADETPMGLRRALESTRVPEGVTDDMTLDEVVALLERTGAVTPFHLLVEIAAQEDTMAVAIFSRLSLRGELPYWAGRLVNDPEYDPGTWLKNLREQVISWQI